MSASPSLGILGVGLFGSIAASVLIHGFVKYLHGPTPEVRREGVDEVLDVVVGSVMLGTLYALLLAPGSSFLPWLTHEIASAIPVGSTTLANYLPSAGDPQALLRWGYLTAFRYFNETTGFYATFWGTVLTLNLVPVTSPLSWYLQQSTWYLQTMITYTIINLGFIYALNLIAYNAWWLLPLGIGLVIVRQTRSLGTFIVAFLIIVAVLGPLLSAYTVASLSKPLAQLGASNLWSDVTGSLKLIIDQGYSQALVMQTFDVTVDVALAMALAASYGLYRVFDEAIIDVLPL
ncbi:hypothetical protein [Vulcanisaeta distributa]|uniref:Uncharacterized protein n=1 Tax=Vulcanisaeta distributa (strain DSM 14429 / JCM 11212 / NBRC 100878 / IC-017) TaxID=572478 RepID=E1QSP6_VULDI|nr:hypothetical protein [Vulcanisaeta distributa]ADN49563.1 hypothetical protein Vdis_0150 [Vulcanisaeta distributa DSM 14429]